MMTHAKNKTVEKSARRQLESKIHEIEDIQHNFSTETFRQKANVQIIVWAKDKDVVQ